MKKGDIIKFGKYPQDNYSFRTPIEWLVLDFNEKTKEALLISCYGLDCQKYHNVPTDITWEYCDLRKWLNNDFIKLAFSEEEVKKIKVSELKNEDNTVHRTRGGNNTKDRIFCLSFNEAEHYFGSDNDRKCKPNAYARKQGVNVYDRNGCCWWWLRSPGDEQRYAKFVNPRGALDLHGFFADFFDDIAVRPALRIIIDEGLETKQREERERREQEDRIRIQSAFQTLSSIGKGAFIKYGNYPLTADGQKAPIEWLVLDVKGNEALLISRYGLDCQKYHNVPTDITWEDCDLRKWLNNDFIKLAFSEEEAKKIKVSELKNEDNPIFRTRGGNKTKDRIFCLSINEAEYYFGSDNDKQCKPTAYAQEQGAYVNDCCFWWLRSPGLHKNNAAFVPASGSRRDDGTLVDSASNAVRPALRIIFDETLEQRNRREEEERRQREEQERRQRELLAQAHEEFSAIMKKGIRKGMIIPFGAYPQDNDSFRTPIEWLVLDVKKTNFLNRVFAKNKLEVLLISRYALDCKKYHHVGVNTTWEDCDLRKWLNSDFLKSAFSNEESERILVSELRNDNNPEYGTRGGNDTKDRIFCLSIAEALQYFSSNVDRQCRPTAYARKQGSYVNNDCCYWWLRSPGDGQCDASDVYSDGSLFLIGNYVNSGSNAVRPALRIICNL